MVKKILVSTLIVVLIIICISVVILNQRSKIHDDTIYIGRILPLTGPAASYGKSELKGTSLAVEEINSAGGIAGKKLEVIFEDTQCSVKDGVNAMKKLVDIDKVPAVLGATCSGVTLGISPIANEREVLLLSPLSSASAITEAGPFVFRVMPSDAFQSRILAKWIIDEGHNEIAVLYINNAWGEGVATEFTKTFKQLGGILLCTEVCKEGDKDFRVQLTKIKASNPSAFFCPTMPKEGNVILKQMKELGIQTPVYGADAWSVEELTAGGDNIADGVKYTYPAKFTGEAYQTFAAAFKSKYGMGPDVNAAGAYDAVHILAMCIKKVLGKGLPLTGESIRQEMSKVKDYIGATGITTFDDNGDSIAKHFEKMIISNGERIKYGD